jgi:hypothetical protein
VDKGFAVVEVRAVIIAASRMRSRVVGIGRVRTVVIARMHQFCILQRLMRT